jgi:CheY-like chemotaxis protein
MGRRVVVAEDDRDIAGLICEVLQGEGYTVHLTSGSDTLAAVRDLRPDILLLDNNMPGMNGIEIARQLHSDPMTSTVAIVAMTAASNLEIICYQMAADGCLGKPFGIDELIAMLNGHIHSAHS